MSALKTIADCAAEKNLPFLVIGGHAVVAHGYPRNTFDLDIIVRRADSEKWKQAVEELGYVFKHEGRAFLQFDQTDVKGKPLDMMLANDETFAILAAGAVAAPTGLDGVKIVSLLHLIALKCHALKHGHSDRIVKDTGDVLGLMDANRLDPDNPEIRAIFLKYGTADFYEQVRRSRKKS